MLDQQIQNMLNKNYCDNKGRLQLNILSYDLAYVTQGIGYISKNDLLHFFQHVVKLLQEDLKKDSKVLPKEDLKVDARTSGKSLADLKKELL